MTRASRSRLAAALAALALVAAACGDDEADTATPPTVDTAADDTAADDTAADDTSDDPAAGEGPDATVPADLPEELRGQIGPLEVVGAPLPPLEPGVSIADDPARGMVAPVLVGENFAGDTVRVDPAADGPTLVLFLAHWCPHCNSEVPRVNELRDAGSLPADLDVVAVSTAVDPTRPNFPPADWLDRLDWTFPVIADGVDMQAGRFIGTSAYGVTGFPFATLVGSDGEVLARWSGEHSTDELLGLITSNLPA
jgi:cytochrome c biogenesis protein CcmG/thiol:disulfide interchange protein DsbE